MRQALLLTLLGSLFLVACGSSSPFASIPQDQVTVTRETGNDLSRLGRFVRAIPLETPDEALLGGINEIKLDPSSGHLLVGDFKITKRVFRFDQNGRYLHSYGRLGQGPGEYQGLMSFAPLDDGRVVLLSTFKMLLFSAEGKHLKSVRLKASPHGVQTQGNRIYVHAISGEERLRKAVLVYDDDLQRIDSFHPHDQRLDRLPFIARHSLAKGQDALYVSHSYDYRISVYDFEGRPRQIWDLPNSNDDLQPFWTELRQGRLNPKQRLDFFQLLHRPVYTFAVDDLVYLFEVKVSAQLFRSSLLNGKTGALRVYDHIRLLSEELHPANLTMEAVVGSYDRGLIGYCEDPQRLNHHRDHPVLQHINYREADNPVILFFELKPLTSSAQARESSEGGSGGQESI